MNEPPITKPEADGGVALPQPCSALEAALALVDFGPCRDGDPADWINVASPMCAHCIGSEDVNLAAARIIAAEYRKSRDELMLRGNKLTTETAKSNETTPQVTILTEITRRNTTIRPEKSRIMR